MAAIRFFFYLLIFCYCLFQFGKKKLPKHYYATIIVIAFIVRVIVGVVFAYYTQDLGGNDYWILFHASKEETDWLIHNPSKFLYKDILDNNGYAGNPFKSFFFRNGDNLFFNDLKDNIVVKFNAVLNIFSGKNYYINIALSNFLVMVALLGLISVFSEKLHPKTFETIFFPILFYPPLLLWTSNIEKDMLSLVLISLILYCIVFRNRRKVGIIVVYWMMTIIASIILLLIKNYIALILFFSLLVGFIARRSKMKTPLVFLLCTLIGMLLFFLSAFLPDSINLPELLARKQNGFFDIAGDQPIPSIVLNGHVRTYLQNLPHALLNVFVFPNSTKLLSDRIGWIGLFSLFILLLICYSMFRYPLRDKSYDRIFFYVLLTFCLLNYLLIGQTVAYYGALLRYRSIIETIAIILMMQNVDFNKIRNTYIKKVNI